MLRSRQKWSKHFSGRCPNILTVLLIYRPQQHVFFSRFVCPWKFRNRRSLYYKCKDFLTEINWNEVGKILLRFWQKKMLDFCPWRSIYPPQRKAFPLIWHIRNGLNNLDWEKWRPVREISFQNWAIQRLYQQNIPYRYQMRFLVLLKVRKVKRWQSINQ